MIAEYFWHGLPYKWCEQELELERIMGHHDLIPDPLTPLSDPLSAQVAAPLPINRDLAL